MSLRKIAAIICLFFLVSASAIAFLLLVPNSWTDRLASFQVSRLARHPITLDGVRIKPSADRLAVSVQRADLGALPHEKIANLEQFLKGMKFGERIVLEDSRWVVMAKGGGLNIRLLSGRIGDASVQGGFFLKDGKTEKLLTRIRVPADSLQPFSQLIDSRFPRSRDGHRVAKLSSGGGRWVLWGSRGPVLEARWQ